MSATKGYYSLVQFCPDASRLEAVNIGVVLFCPEAKFISARTVRGVGRAAKLVGRAGVDRASLTAAKRALERRLDVDRDSFSTLADFQHFVDSRANVLKLTTPRPLKVFEPAQELEKLFAELVGGVARPPVLLDAEPPRIGETFRRLEQAGRAKINWQVTVPVIGRSLDIPYAYRNGVWNLVKPYRFSNQEVPALGAAMRLAIEGDLLQKYEAPDDGRKQLIILPSFAQVDASSLQDRVYELLTEYHVKTIPETGIDEFLSQVDREAHS